jgi:hypothetical protein
LGCSTRTQKLQIEASWTLEYLFRMMIEITTEDSWQPIETAPKDGSQVVVYGKHAQWSSADGAIVTIGHYFAGLDCWMTDSGVMYDATHWMPLPESPENLPAKQQPNRQAKKINKRTPLKKFRSIRE